jgi:hypothetical protein
MSVDALLESLRCLDVHGEENDWTGPDPYEALNATRFTWPLRDTTLGKRVLLQVVKRSPVNLRPVMGIKPTPNSAAAAWALSAYCLGGFLDADKERMRIERGVERVLALRSPHFTDNSWGYKFPTQSRVFFYERDAPSTVATVWAGHALLDAAERLDRDDLVGHADSTGRFLIAHVPQTTDEPGAFFGYLVGDRSPIHNSNLLACAFLARLGRRVGNEVYLASATRGVEWSLARQRPDGSWPYGEMSSLGWVDGFHTGYVLDALDVCMRAHVPLDILPAWERGLAFYRAHLFLDNGTPKYYGNAVYPIDSLCVAQGIQTLALAADRDACCLSQSWAVLEWALRRMRRPDGLFMFQRSRLWANRIPHMRWAEASTFLAMAHLLAAQRCKPQATSSGVDPVILRHKQILI